MKEPRLLDLGDTAMTLEFGDAVDPVLNQRVMAARNALGNLPGVVDLVPTYRSLTVHFDPQRLPREELEARLLQAAKAPEQYTEACRHWRIPVVFGGDYGPDLEDVAIATGRSKQEIVDAFCQIQFRVFMIGFLPGFPYLGELPEWLRLPRRPSPRTSVPARSVAIAGAQAAVYPWQSPGGWHLIGQTPVPMFDATRSEAPALLTAGDDVTFASVSEAEFARFKAAADRRQWHPEELVIA